MEKIKMDFLKKNVGFRKKDLSVTRQLELNACIEKYGLEWVLLALSRSKLEDWEKWGFTLFNKPEFKEDVDSILKAFVKMDSNKIEQAMKKDERKLVDERSFTELYSKLLEQGSVEYYNDQQVTAYYYIGVPEMLAEVNMMLAEARPQTSLTEMEKLKIMANVRKYIMVEAGANDHTTYKFRDKVEKGKKDWSM